MKYPEALAGLVAMYTSGWKPESWSTCSLGSLPVGSVLALPGNGPVRPALLAEKPVRVDVPADATVFCDARREGTLIGRVHYLDTGEAEGFELLAKRSVLARCDLVYVPAGTDPDGVACVWCGCPPDDLHLGCNCPSIGCRTHCCQL